MPAPETSHLYQPAVLRARTAVSSTTRGVDAYSQPTLTTPVEIRVRWDDTKRERIDPEGNRVVVDATALVDRDIEVGSEMWKGALSDWYGTGLGQDENTEIMVVKTFNATPDVRNRYVTREVGLMKKSLTFSTAE